MPGFRIHHPTLRNSVLLVPVPPKTRRGTAKNVQIVLADEGNTIVSEGVWSELQYALAAGHEHSFVILNEVPDPPALAVGFSSAPDRGRSTYQLEQDALREIAPAGVHTRVVESGLIPSFRSN